MNILFFDTETTGLPNRSQPLNHPSQPSITQLGAILEINGQDAFVIDTLVKPNGWQISPQASALTGITLDMCEESGIPIEDVIDLFMMMAANADFIVAHNIEFDQKLASIEFSRLNNELPPATVMCGRPALCTMKKTTPLCKIPKKDNRTGWKWPKLTEAYWWAFGEQFENAHSAIADIQATRRLFNFLREEGHFDAEFEKLADEQQDLAA